jgi:hypothetical protein
MLWKIVTGVFVVLLVGGVGWYMWFMGSVVRDDVSSTATPLLLLADSPRNASYNIDGTEVQLMDGYAEVDVVPDSASKAVTTLWGELVYGDLDSDGDEDALLILTHSEGGSGTFYYVAVAVRKDEGYLGTNAVLLGDRIAPETMRIWYDLAVVNYLERTTSESFANEPSVAMGRYFAVEGARLSERGPYEEGVEVRAGGLVYGHESRTFTPCKEDALWLAPDSPSVGALRAIYTMRTFEAAPYTPAFMVLAGTYVDAPEEGFGVDYEQAFRVVGVLSAPKNSVCTTESVPTNLEEEV